MRHRDIIWLQCDPAVDWQLAGHSKAQPHNATGYDASANQMSVPPLWYMPGYLSQNHHHPNGTLITYILPRNDDPTKSKTSICPSFGEDENRHV
ncbi:hypothetical protein A1F94_001249 [Pyrenophora tritici-repentis]|uniref:Uncharacterized protein n=1 Tax=Pyrenophora tritici-repentis TaxID=45151 RepID=A0A922NGG5_9PLEO|nr:hypothetical protein A1F94_001249 [Pyrenophora tritici-repentis]KAI1513661.1 hypothetical protein Ptr86124_007563 [Pyrenophora tritici-repentis]KAI1674219.1 hypothetical protein L13192_00966 [Pyrenophora tritici-repentis]KAI1688673.1 hypothetical protein KJE20_01851 [Pyrenophora tritici-repentis]